MEQRMNLHCLGINHRTAPIEVREKMWFSADDARPALSILREGHFRECVLISTCNRTELYYVLPDRLTNGSPAWKTLSALKHDQGVIQEHHFYHLSSLKAAQHLFKLASGIDSMVLGDIQILNQLKSAFALAQESRTSGLLLNRLFNNALHVGKRVRTETEIDDGAISVGYAAAELATKIFQDLSGKTALLIGAGETGELTAKHLHGHRLGRLLITNRTRDRAEALRTQLEGSVVDFEQLKTVLPKVDIVISSVAVPGYVLSKADLQDAMKQRDNRTLVIIDLGMPRNIDPGANTLGNVFLNDIDTLNDIVDRNLERRKAEIPDVQRIILEELVKFNEWHNSLQVGPTIQDLRSQFEHIRQEEVTKTHFTSNVEDEVAVLTKRIVNKILHEPMVNLRTGMSHEGAHERIALLRSLFGLSAENDAA